MRIELRCPVHARVRRAFAANVHAFGVETLTFDIKEAASDDFPVVISFRSGRSGDPKVVYRRSADPMQMYRSVGRVPKVQERRNFDNFHERQQQGFNVLLGSDDELFLKLKRDGRQVYPADLSADDRWSPLGEMGFERINQTDIEDRVREAQAILDSYVVVDGSVWEPCREPVFVVQRGTTAWTAYLVDQHQGGRSWDAYFFAADEHEQAVAWMDVLDAEVRPCPHVGGTVTYAPDFASAIPGERLDVARVAGLVMETMRTGAKNIGDYPPEAIIIYGKLKKFADEFDVDHSEKAVEEALSAISRLVEMEVEGLIVRQHFLPGVKEGILSPYANSISLHFRRFEDRRITFEPVPAVYAPR
ncbi:hypothetical protein HFN89_05440 [Rhizobium laguerreae]|nr:hypothetical protein [Rhizobium laguerreae]